MPTFRSNSLVAIAALGALAGSSAFAAETDTQPPSMERPEAQRGEPVQGHIVELDVAARTLHLRPAQQGGIATTTEPREIHVGDDARIKLDGKDAQFTDLRAGDRAVVHLQQGQQGKAMGQKQQDRQGQPGQDLQPAEAKLIRAYRTEPAPFDQLGRDDARVQGQGANQPGGMGKQPGELGQEQDDSLQP